MISFRFHVVSIIAMFLAMAIGVVVGSTYIEDTVVDGLRNRIGTVSDNLDLRKRDNDRLESDLGEARRYIEASSDFAVTDRLTDVSVLLVATRGVDEAPVEQVTRLARQAGATVPGVVWLESRWALDDDSDRAALAEIVQAPGNSAVEGLWSEAWSTVVGEMTAPDGSDPDPEVAPSSTAPSEPRVDVLTALEAGGFVTVDSLGDASANLSDLLGTNPSVVVLTGTRAQDEVLPLVGVVVSAAVEGGLPTVAADVYVEAPEAPGRGEALIDAIPAGQREVVALVDHADRSEGQTATVLALDALRDGNPGHFGLGSDADDMLPDWTPP